MEWLDELQLIVLLDELPRRPMLAGREGLRLSLAGAQDKLPVVFDGKRIGLPQGGYPSTHILKPPIHAVEDSVSNEGYCLALARLMGMLAVQAEIHTVVDRRFLLVERYDRQMDEQGRVVRVHQEDMCQALGVVSEMKNSTAPAETKRACVGVHSVRNRVSSAESIIKVSDRP